MPERALRTTLVVMAILITGVAGYLFGFSQGRSAERTVEAAQDLIIPAEDVRRERIRRDGIRDLTERLMAFQADFHATHGSFAQLDSISVSRDGYVVEPTSDGSYWIGVVRSEDWQEGEACAVALNREPVYAFGIPLRRAGRVRCSWDLATRLNRLISGGV